MKLLITTLVVLTTAITAIAAPVTTKEATPSFKLKSCVLGTPNATFEGLYLNAFGLTSDFAWAILESTTVLDPLVGSINGTAAELANNEGFLYFNFGYPSNSGFVIRSDREVPPDTNKGFDVTFEAGNATQGLFINQGILKYNDPQSGGWYSCLNPLVTHTVIGPDTYPSTPELFYKPKNFDTPAGCSDIELLVEYV